MRRSPVTPTMRRAGSACLALMLWLTAGQALAQEQVAFLGVRARPGVASDWLVNEAGRLLEQRLQQFFGPALVTQAAVSRALGSPLALGSCLDDGCMTLFGSTVGVRRAVWGYVDRPRPGVLVVTMRTLAVPEGTLLGEANPGCTGCDEPGLLAVLASVAPPVLGLGGGTTPAVAAEPAAPPLPPSQVLQVPGVHRPLDPAEEARAGWLTVISEPPGATVSLFSYPVGTTPVNGLRLLPGAYAVRVELPGHQELAGTMTVRTGQETRQQLRLTPAPAALMQTAAATQPATPWVGHLTIQTQPELASLHLDGEPLGQSPVVQRQVPAGEHLISAYLPGYELTEQRLMVQAGSKETVSLKLIESRAVETTMTVRSTPPGATVQVGSLRLGQTPLQGIRFRPGRHVLRLLLDGYPAYELPVEIKEGDQFELEADLAQGPPAESLLGSPSP